MATPAEIRDELLKDFYDMYMKDAPTCVTVGPADPAENRREIDWLVDQRWVDRSRTGSLKLSVAGRNEYERRLAHGAGPCPTCGRE